MDGLLVGLLVGSLVGLLVTLVDGSVISETSVCFFVGVTAAGMAEG